MANMGTLAVKLEAKTAEFKRRMKDAGKSVDGFSREGERDLAKFDRAIGKIETSMTRAAGVIGTSLAGIATGVFAATTQLVNTGREVENFARLTNTSTRDFQELAIGARRFGFESDKVADILKDMNDRVGDFIQTGGGPMADFFENVAPKVGVTADQFRNLSGKDALQLYVSSLEKANLSQADMTFYMEAIASDSTVLLPLLQENGKALKDIGDEAERTGRILSEMDLKALADMDEELRSMKGTLEGVKNEVLIGALPAMREFTALMSDENTTQNLQTLAQAAVQLATWMGKAASETASFSKWMGEELAARINGIAKDDVVRMQQRLEDINDILSTTNIGAIDFFKGEFYSKSELEAEAKQLKKDIEAALKAQKITAPVSLSGGGTVQEQRQLTDKQESLIKMWTQKIAEYEQRIMSGENAAPLQEEIKLLRQKIEDEKKAVDEAKKPTKDNTKSTKDNTEEISKLTKALTTPKPEAKSDGSALRAKEPEGGFKEAGAWDQFISRSKFIAGSESLRTESDRAVFENAARGMIARYEQMGGYDTDKMREQFEELAQKMGTKSKEGMKEAAEELTSGGGGKSIGSITINLKSDNGEASGEVTGDTAFLNKLASTLQSVSTAV